MSYERALKTALDAALEAGELLRRELHRWGGPRGHSAHAEADEEAEWLIRKRLMAVFPSYWYRGEETGSIRGSEPHVWLVDPNDGTSAFLRGGRGSSVSIGLIRGGVPVLGVVYAFAAPDDRGDLLYWAEGFELTRNGRPVRTKWNSSIRNQVLLLVSLHREHVMTSVLDAVQPFRFRAYPSIAYRLALAAAGDAEAAVSWHNPGDWDYAGGHALILGAGGIFLSEDGREITYAEDGASKVKRCYGGDPNVVRDLVRRDWTRVQSAHGATAPASKSYFPLSRPRPGKAVASAGLLSRAQGCLLGQCAGDALGEQVEFMTPDQIRRIYPNGLRTIEDGGMWNTIAGQPTDDSELALLLARSIAQSNGYDREKVAQAYDYWFDRSHPFDIGNTTRQAMSAVTREDVRRNRAAEVMSSAAGNDSQANGSLMRISPLAIFGYRKQAGELWAMAEQESALTHPHPVCKQACAIFTIAVALAIRTGAPAREIYDFALRHAETRGVEPPLLAALRRASDEPVRDAVTSMGWVLIAFQNAFHQLLYAPGFEQGLVNTVMLGGDADTNGAIAGALLGAAHGRDAIPQQWSRVVLSCRPDSLTNAVHPRPHCLWPVDLPILAELLLTAG